MKNLLIIFSSVLAVFIAAAAGGHVWLQGRLEKKQIVAQIEATWNCRAQLDGTALSIVRSPAQVELRGLKLAPRNSVAGASLDESETLISLDRAVLTVDLLDLLRGKLNVKQLHFYGLHMKTEVRADGESNLRDLFAKPGADMRMIEKGDKPPESAASAVVTPQPDAAGRKSNEVVVPVNPEFKAGDMMVALHVDEAGVDEASFVIKNRESGTSIILEHVSFSLKNMDVNPESLATHNRCDIEYAGSLRVEKTDGSTKMANLTVSGTGSMNPFDIITHEWDPDLMLMATVKKGALLGGQSMESQMSEKDIKKFTDWGVDISGILVGGVLGEDMTTQVHVVHGKTTVSQDARLVFPQYEITLLNGSWFHAGHDAINAHARLVVGQELTTRIIETARKTIIKKVGIESVAKSAASLLEEALLDPQKRLNFPFKAKGKLSSPSVEPDFSLSDFKDSLLEKGRNILKNLFGQ